MNIDQALIALCEKHDLTSLNIQLTQSVSRPSGFAFTTFAHWEQGGEYHCAHSIEASSAEAIAPAIQQVNEARACVVDVPAMELGEVVL